MKWSGLKWMINVNTLPHLFHTPDRINTHSKEWTTKNENKTEIDVAAASWCPFLTISLLCLWMVAYFSFFFPSHLCRLRSPNNLVVKSLIQLVACQRHGLGHWQCQILRNAWKIHFSLLNCCRLYEMRPRHALRLESCRLGSVCRNVSWQTTEVIKSTWRSVRHSPNIRFNYKVDTSPSPINRNEINVVLNYGIKRIAIVCPRNLHHRFFSLVRFLKYLHNRIGWCSHWKLAVLSCPL